MKVIRDGIKLCGDCTVAAVNGDFSGLDYYYTSGNGEAAKRQAEIEAGLERLGPHLVCATTEGEHEPYFSWSPCDCCNTHLGGDRFDFAILGEG
jgi:hypothetical protein